MEEPTPIVLLLLRSRISAMVGLITRSFVV